MMALPLAGIRVIDFSHILAGPFCTMVLADLGADVIKIERPGQGDETRGWGPPFAGPDAAYFLAVNRNKRSVVLDLTRPADASVARELIRRSDVVVENFRPGLMDSWGLGYSSLRAEQQRLVYCRIEAFSDQSTAPRPGFDLAIQAMSGLMSITGQPGGEPTKVGVAISDLITALYAAIAIQAALRQRDIEDRGELVSISLFDAGVAALANQWANYLIGGVVPGTLGNRHPNVTPYESYVASDRPFILAAATDRHFQRTCEVIGRPDLASDPRYATNRARLEHRNELTRELDGVFRTRTAAEWLRELEANGIPCGVVRSLDQVFASPEGAALVEQVDDPIHGELRLVRGPLRPWAAHAIRRPPPGLGAHTAEVLAELNVAPGG